MRRAAASFIEVEQWVLANYYPHLSRSREKHVRSLFRRHFHPAKWYATPLEKLTQYDIATWFHTIKAVYAQEANHCLAVFRVCWKQAQIAGLIPDTLQAPGKLLQKTPANRRSRFITPQEMPRLLYKLSEAHALLRPFIVFILETACRSGEALQAQWADIDLDGGLWHQPANKTKNGRAHTVALTTGAIAALRELDRASLKPFPMSKGWYEGQWLKFRATCGLHDVTFHDLRRTRLTWLAAQGMPLKDLQRVSGHLTIQSIEPYLHQFGNLGHIRAAMEQASSVMRGPFEAA